MHSVIAPVRAIARYWRELRLKLLANDGKLILLLRRNVNGDSFARLAYEFYLLSSNRLADHTEGRTCSLPKQSQQRRQDASFLLSVRRWRRLVFL